jgi:hypothetical protein
MQDVISCHLVIGSGNLSKISAELSENSYRSPYNAQNC